jgi:single-strand DNA-binding protein
MRVTTSGTNVTEFSLAVDNPLNKEQTSFFRVKAWGKTAEFVANYLSKGRLVSVDGRLEQRTYEKDGQKREIVEVVAERVQGLDRPKDDAPKAATAITDEYDPFGDE